MKKRLANFKKAITEYELNNPYGHDYIRDEYLDSDGNAVIEINTSGAELYNPLTVGKQRELSGDIYETIDAKAYTVPVAYHVKLKLYGVPECEKEHVKALIGEHYGLQLRDKRLDLRINLIKSISMFAVGLILLAIYFVLANSGLNAVWYEILSIIATFIVWEGADFAILERRSVKTEYYYAAQMALAEVEFADFNEPEE